jgi:hypothetical protein
MTDAEVIARVKQHIDPDDNFADGFNPDVALKIGRYVESKIGPHNTRKPFSDKRWNLVIGDLYFYELETRG